MPSRRWPTGLSGASARGTEHRGSPQAHEYELRPAVEDIDHSRAKTKSPRTNGVCGRFHRAVSHECHQGASRERIHGSAERLRAGLDARAAGRNEERPHRGRWRHGKAPLRTFVGAVPLTKEKMPAAAWRRTAATQPAPRTPTVRSSTS